RAKASARTTRRHDAKQCVCYREHEASNAKNATTDAIAAGTQDGVDSYTISSDTAWGYEDFVNFIRAKGQDPDKVTFRWGVTSPPNGGIFNMLNDVGLKPVAAFEAFTDQDIAEAQERLRNYELPLQRAPRPAGAPCAAVLNPAD